MCSSLSNGVVTTYVNGTNVTATNANSKTPAQIILGAGGAWGAAVLMTWNVALSPAQLLNASNFLAQNYLGVGLPPPGQRQLFWCAFGLSNASAATMFPAQVAALQLDPRSGAVVLEDRDSFVGFQSPPCYAQQLSQLLNGSGTGADGGLSASWTRPLALGAAPLAAHYLDIVPRMTVIAASSADTGAAAARCEPQMQLHSLCVPGVAVDFGGEGRGHAAAR